MPMYNLLDYSDNYLKTAGSLCQYYRNEPSLNNDDSVINFGDNNTSVLFKYEEKIIYQTGGFGPKGVEILVPLKYLNNFWRTLEIPLISCEIKSHSNLVYALFHTI